MARRDQCEEPADLARGRTRFTTWRRNKKKPKSRIPESLWKMAVRLAVKHGLHRTARTLKIDYYALKKRTAAAEAGRAESDSPFIELPSVPSTVQECVIELENVAGIFRVHLKGYNALEVATVGRSMRETP